LINAALSVLSDQNGRQVIDSRGYKPAAELLFSFLVVLLYNLMPVFQFCDSSVSAVSFCM